MAPSERKVPILRSDNSLIDKEFDSVREKFEFEMSKMEQEMTRFRSQLLASELSSQSIQSSSSSASKSSNSTATTTSSSQTSSSKTVRNAQSTISKALNERSKFEIDYEQANFKRPQNRQQLDYLDSPLIKDEGDGKILKLRFDVTAYEPEQIIVKTIDNRLTIHARKEERSENMSMYREYNREFLLPQGLDPETIRSSLSADGVLTVEAPLPVLNSS